MQGRIQQQIQAHRHGLLQSASRSYQLRYMSSKHAVVDRSEGDVNLSEERKKWHQSMIGPTTSALLKADADVFLHQSLSSPCLNALKDCDGIYIEDVEGRRMMDFHGNSVHQVTSQIFSIDRDL